MRRYTKLLWLLLIGGIVNSPSAEIYKWVDNNGKVHFTDSPPEQVKTQKVTLQINSFTSPNVSQFRFDPALISKRKVTTQVVMYSTSWCGYCKKARRYFLQQNIPFEEYDVEKSAKGKKDYKALGGRGVPIIVAGDRTMNGFSEQAFERFYRK